MKISLAASDVSQDFETAVELGYEWGIRDFELRHVFSRRVPDISDEEEQRIIRVIKEYNVNITAISPGLFKIPLISQKLKDHLKVRLPDSFRLAEKLGTNMVIVMGGIKSKGEKREGAMGEIVDVLQKAAKRAQKVGMILALENEDICWADTGRNTAQIIKMVDSPALKINWDPGNAFGFDEQPYPAGYNYVKDHIVNVHVKDALINGKTNLKKYVVLGEGNIDWHSQVEALKNDGYEGYLSIEAHVSPRVKSSYRCYQWLRETLEKIKEN